MDMRKNKQEIDWLTGGPERNWGRTLAFVFAVLVVVVAMIAFAPSLFAERSTRHANALILPKTKLAQTQRCRSDKDVSSRLRLSKSPGLTASGVALPNGTYHGTIGGVAVRIEVTAPTLEIYWPGPPPSSETLLWVGDIGPQQYMAGATTLAVSAQGSGYSLAYTNSGTTKAGYVQ